MTIFNQVDKLKKSLATMKRLNKSQVVPVVEAVRYMAPDLSLLKDYNSEATTKTLDSMILEEKLSEFGFESHVENVSKGPVITRYEMKLAKGVRLSKIRNVSEDIAIALMSDSIRIQAPIPGTSLVGIEIANDEAEIIGLKRILSGYNGTAKLPISIGVDTIGNPKIIDLAKMPHLLIAGQTGSGKSVCINSIILSLLYTKTPEECELVLVDPKRVEMASYANMPHLRVPVVTEPDDAVEVFQSLISEMESRYELLQEYKVRNIESYNEKAMIKMPYIVTLVDEMSDLMMTSGKELEAMIVRIAQLARAVGIHLVLATQRPVAKVITGLIKSNMPSRIAFQVASKLDSRVILDDNGAEKLIGRGDMLMLNPGMSEPERFHGAWVSDDEILAVTDHIKGI